MTQQTQPKKPTPAAPTAIQPTTPPEAIEWSRISPAAQKIIDYWRYKANTETKKLQDERNAYKQHLNDFKGLIKRSNKEIEMVSITRVLSIYSKYKDPRQAWKAVFGNGNLIKITLGAVIAVLAIIITLEISDNPNFRDIVGQNLLVVGAILVAITFAGVYFWRQTKHP